MCFFAASATASSGETASSGDKTLRLARGSDIQTMDVHKTSSSYCIPMNIFERLFESKLNDNGRTEQPVLRPCGDPWPPATARESWSVTGKSCSKTAPRLHGTMQTGRCF